MRETPEAAGALLVRSPGGAAMPLDQVARTSLREVVTTDPPPAEAGAVTAVWQAIPPR